MHPLAKVVRDALEEDLKQMVEEGHDAAALRAELDTAAKAGSVEALLELQQEWWARPSPPGYPYDEPNDWETISSGFPDPDSHAKFTGSDEALRDRLLGGWQGRCAGCQLGMPIEKIESCDPATIRRILETAGSYPLTGYMEPWPEAADTSWLPGGDYLKEKRRQCKGGFDCAGPDDDLHYAIISQLVLEKYGLDYEPAQAARLIADLTPYSWLWSSGKNAVRMALLGLSPPYTALFGNPCRQSLGAQIRCDVWGWAAPGNPALAARLAYKDATISQTRNGIYSGIFFSVLIADVLAHGDPARAVETAEQYVPPRSRLAEMIRLVKEQCRAHTDWQAVCDAIHAKDFHYPHRFNHAIPNAAIVVLGLLKGGGDFTETLGITVMSGLDTDCTGATAGSIMGCALGAGSIPAHWVEPFNDTIRTELAGMDTVKISELATRMFKIAQKNVRR